MFNLLQVIKVTTKDMSEKCGENQNYLNLL